MKVDFSTILKDFDSTPILDGKDGSNLTLWKVAVRALSQAPVQSGISVNDTVDKRYDLIVEILNSKGVIDLTSDKIVLLKASIPVVLASSIFLAGQCFRLLEGKPTDLAEVVKEFPVEAG